MYLQEQEQSKAAGCKPSEAPILVERIIAIKNQQEQLNSIMKDMYGFVDGVKSIGMKLNSVNHPDNIPIDMQGATKGQCCTERNPTDGFVNELDRIIDFNSSFINEFNNKIYDPFRKNMAYIESHI